MTDYKNQIEAILFASGRLMGLQTIMDLTGASQKQVILNNIKKLTEEYEQRNSPMMIVAERAGWKITVREKYLPLVRKIVSDMELPKTMLETLAVIAWKAPVLQSDVVNVRHNKAYGHISELEELGFITKEPKGRSYLLKLTQKFYDYFDIEGTHDIKEFLKKAKMPEPEEVPSIKIYEDKEDFKEEEKVVYGEGREHLGALEVYTDENEDTDTSESNTAEEMTEDIALEEDVHRLAEDLVKATDEEETDDEDTDKNEPSEEEPEGLEEEPHDEEAADELFEEKKPI